VEGGAPEWSSDCVPDVYRYITGKVQWDLPALVITDDPLAGETAGALAGAQLIVLACTGGGAGNTGKDHAAREPKTVQEQYKETYRTLLRFGVSGM
jgi:hypothetical protein